MKKKIDASTIVNELKVGSAFFPRRAEQSTLGAPELSSDAEQVSVKEHSADMVPRYCDTTDATTVSSLPSSLAETTRRAVKKVGKEAATYRFTVEEKQALATIVHEYRQQGIRTSDNELTRIALNYLLEDYRRNKKESILSCILQLLHT